MNEPKAARRTLRRLPTEERKMKRKLFALAAGVGLMAALLTACEKKTVTTTTTETSTSAPTPEPSPMMSEAPAPTPTPAS